MSRLVKGTKDFLLVLSKSAKKQLKPLVGLATKIQIKAIQELIVNLLQGNIPLSARERTRLAKYKVILRRIAGGSVSRLQLLKYVTVIVQFLIIIRPFLESL